MRAPCVVPLSAPRTRSGLRASSLGNATWGLPGRRFSTLLDETTQGNTPGSPSHASLSSFLAYARRSGLSSTSTTYIGTRYEYLCLNALKHLGFQLVRSGGRSDAGVDLYGTWSLPSLPIPLRCIVQCKALTSRAGPNLVRELEGAFTGAPLGWRGEDVVGLLCAPKEASKGIRDAVRRSGRGVVWAMIEDERRAEQAEQAEQADARIQQLLWNERVADLGAAGVDVGLIYDNVKDREGNIAKEVRLMWKGKLWTPEV